MSYILILLLELFYIDINSGVICVKISFDRENVDIYILIVIVIDRDCNIVDCRLLFVNVIVILIDVNDNDFVFFFDYYKVSVLKFIKM